MKFKADEIASVIQKEIEGFEAQIDVREVGQVLQNVFQASEDEIATVGRVRSNEKAEGSRLEHFLLEEGLGHGQLVQVGK